MEEKTAVEQQGTVPAINNSVKSTPPAKVPEGMLTLGEGFEEPIQSGDLRLSRAVVVQPTTKEFINDPQRFKLGTLIDNITLNVLPMKFVPIMKFTFWIKFNPKDKNDPNFDPAYDLGAIIYRTSNPQDERVIKDGNFGENDEKPRATKYINYLCVFEGERLPIILSFSKTSLKAGVNLFNIAFRRGGNMYDGQYSLKTIQKESDQGGHYYIMEVEQSGDSDEKTRAIARYFREHFSKLVKPMEDLVVLTEEQAEPSEARPY